MSNDEVFTVEALKTCLSLMTNLIQQHNGRVMDATGDNLLAEFSSAVDAVQFAVVRRCM